MIGAIKHAQGDGREGLALCLPAGQRIRTQQDGWQPVEALQPGQILWLPGQAEACRLAGLIFEQRLAERRYHLLCAGDVPPLALLTASKCLAAGSRIETPDGPRAVETLRPGEQVWGLEAGLRLPTRVVAVFSKSTTLPALPGRRLSPDVTVTDNHHICWHGLWIHAAQTSLPEQAVRGTVYDLLTETGTYYAAGLPMGLAGFKGETSLWASRSPAGVTAQPGWIPG